MEQLISKLLPMSSLSVDITDTGMGIPENEQADIWKRFYRGRLVNTKMVSE